MDPNVQRKTARAASTETFEAIGREWLAHRAKTTAAITQEKATWLLEQIFSEIGSRAIREVAASELLAALRKIETRGHHESAHGPSRNADRCSGTQSRQAVPSATSP